MMRMSLNKEPSISLAQKIDFPVWEVVNDSYWCLFFSRGSCNSNDCYFTLRNCHL